jgi:hypothetical protein
MREHADHHDADLLLRLYDLRREEKLRQAREWFVREFQADSMEDLFKRLPFGTKENDYYRMVVSYWEMAASMVKHGLINEELFFENNGELWGVWSKIKHFVPEFRSTWKNPSMYRNLESVAEKYEEWMEGHAPGALQLMSERMKALVSRNREK